MAAFSLTREDALRHVAEVERALAEGYPPTMVHGIRGTAVTVAARRLGINKSQILRDRVGWPDTPGYIEKNYDIAVDWSKYEQRSQEPVATATGEVSDPVELRRLKDEITRLRASLADTERRAAHAENIRAEVLGLHEMPTIPVQFPPREHGDGSAETAVLLLGDLHWGERVYLEAMDGLNSFNLDIARKRLGRWTNAASELLTKHWAGPAPERIVILLGGDLISGGIHNELAKTDELRPLPAVRDVAEHLRQAILKLKLEVDSYWHGHTADFSIAIDIISLPGNHARTTIKPESKEASSTSLDMLVSDFLEVGLQGTDGISFFAPASPDALFSVYGWRVLATHGDRIGSRGGTGFIGPAATAARGFKKVIADYAARGIHIDLILIFHFHAPMQLEEGFVNGSLPGPTEFSRDGRFRPHPAMQLMFTMHPRHRFAQIRWIEVGHPDEGSLYEPPPVDRPLRPRFRVKAVSHKV